MTSFSQLRQRRHRAWLLQAHNDLAFAQLAKDNGFLAQSCYVASQTAEKGLKGALVGLGVEPPHAQVLNDLVQRLGDNGLNTDQLETLPLRALSRMAIQSRYPWTQRLHQSCLTRRMPNKRWQQPLKCSTSLRASISRADGCMIDADLFRSSSSQQRNRPIQLSCSTKC